MLPRVIFRGTDKRDLSTYLKTALGGTTLDQLLGELGVET
jgi:hypothetical protein